MQISDVGARAIFESAEQYPRPFDKAWAPLWLRLEYAPALLRLQQ